jgi:hypothetical protein
MKSRCSNPNVDCFDRYGGRGIKFDPSFVTFEGFLLGIPDGYQEGLELDRIDNDGDYVPGNLRWATRREQVENSSTCGNVTDPQSGELMTYPQLAERNGLSTSQLFQRTRRRNGDVAAALKVKAHSSRSRLTPEVVKGIRKDLFSMTQKDIADWYGISLPTVRGIADGVTYVDIT